MSKESIPQHNAQVLKEEQKATAAKLAEEDTIRRCDAKITGDVLKHEQKAEAKNLKDQAKANAEKLKL
jgi:hypothetical protein